MSVEQVKAFIEKMKTDEAFREQIMAIETPEERLKAIVAAGFECSEEEINEAGVELVDASGGKCSPALCPHHDFKQYGPTRWQIC